MYTIIWNVLSNPAGVMPVTTVQESEQDFDDGHGDIFSNRWKKAALGTKGLPVHVQVIGYKFEDEKVIAIMKHLERSMRKAAAPEVKKASASVVVSGESQFNVEVKAPEVKHAQAAVSPQEKPTATVNQAHDSLVEVSGESQFEVEV